MKRRTSYLEYNALHELGSRPPVVLWSYDKKKKYVCRLELNSAGIAVYTGPKGRSLVADLSWEKFVKRLKSTKNGKK